MVAAEKAKIAAAQEMQAEATEEVERLPEPVEMATDDKMEEKVEYDVKTGLNKDGSCVSNQNYEKPTLKLLLIAGLDEPEKVQEDEVKAECKTEQVHAEQVRHWTPQESAQNEQEEGYKEIKRIVNCRTYFLQLLNR